MKASVLFITYNHGKYIEKAIAGLLLQKECPDFEVIIADDASKDNTVDVIKEKLKGFSNVSIFSNERNLGITKNYQKGFSLCKGEYVFVLEGDDYWIDPYKMKRQVDFMDSNPFCAMCFHPFITQKNESGIFSTFRTESASPVDLFAINDLILNEGLIANFSVCCYRKSALNQLPQSIFELVTYDWMINISVAQFGFLGRINTAMSVYRLSETGVWSNKRMTDKLKETLKLIPGYDKALDYKYADLFSAKIQLLTEQIRNSNRSAKISWRSFIPPVLIFIVKMICPPVLLDQLKNK